MRRIHGSQLLEFFLYHNYKVDENIGGQASIYSADNPDPFGGFFNVPHEQFLGEDYIKRTLEKRGFTVKEFLDWLDVKGKR